MEWIKDKPDKFYLKWFLLFLLLFLMQCTQNQDCAQTKLDEDYLPAIQCEADFALLKGAPLSMQYAQVDAVYHAGDRMALGADFFDFAMDIEFKLDRGSRKIYVKQARPY